MGDISFMVKLFVHRSFTIFYEMPYRNCFCFVKYKSLYKCLAGKKEKVIRWRHTQERKD